MVDTSRDNSAGAGAAGHRASTVRHWLRMVGIILVIIATVEGLIMALLPVLLPSASGAVELIADAAVLTLVSAPLIWWLVVRPLDRRIRAEQVVIEGNAQVLQEHARTREFDSRLHRALEMCATEPGVLDVVDRATRMVRGVDRTQLLLADSSHAHLRTQALSEQGGSDAGCGVEVPWDCAAVREGQALSFESSDDLDACPRLRGRPQGACSAVCVPVTVLGRAVGVLHAPGPDRTLLADRSVGELKAVTSQVGTRLGMLRALAQSQVQAATDGLTGLLNRRSLETKASALIERGEPFALLMGDLDRFKLLNDTYGHDAGDRALRLFANTLQASMRPDDLASRYGGEEFVCVLPAADRPEAVEVAERVRSSLSQSLEGGSVPAFTVSIGVVESSDASSFVDLVRLADAAMYEAKTQGRDRVVAAAPSGHPSPIRNPADGAEMAEQGTPVAALGMMA